jgi:hypothetical protein
MDRGEIVEDTIRVAFFEGVTSERARRFPSKTLTYARST